MLEDVFEAYSYEQSIAQYWGHSRSMQGERLYKIFIQDFQPWTKPQN